MTLPVLIVTGFLGAGKTTTINKMLSEAHGRRIAAVVNDFGAINIDAALIAEQTETVVGLQNGCVCCSLQGDLLRTLKQLIEAPQPFDHVVIEASGVADPQGIIDALADPALWNEARLNAVMTVLDAEDLVANSSRMQDPLWQSQLDLADFVVLNKTASVEASALRMQLAAKGKAALFEPDVEDLPLDLLLDAAKADEPPPAERGGSGDAGFGSDAPGSTGGPAWSATASAFGGAASARRPAHASARFVTLEWTADQPAGFAAFQAAIDQLMPQLVRAKGLIDLKERPGRPLLFQLVGARATLVAYRQPVAQSQLVLIGERGKFDPEAAKALLSQVFSG